MTPRKFAEASAGLVDRLLAPARIQSIPIRSSEVAAYREFVAKGRAMSFRDFQIARGIIAPGHITVDEARFLGELVHVRTRRSRSSRSERCSAFRRSSCYCISIRTRCSSRGQLFMEPIWHKPRSQALTSPIDDRNASRSPE